MAATLAGKRYARATVRQLGTLPTAHAPTGARQYMACGHTAHVGTCPVCQRAQLHRWQAQLAAATQASRLGV